MATRLWLDDTRAPHAHGRLGWTWVRTADDAIALLARGDVVEASLDHDLDPRAAIGETPTDKTGYDVLLWMAAHHVWPPNGVHVHSENAEGAARMRALLRGAR